MFRFILSLLGLGISITAYILAAQVFCTSDVELQKIRARSAVVLVVLAFIDLAVILMFT